MHDLPAKHGARERPVNCRFERHAPLQVVLLLRERRNKGSLGTEADVNALGLQRLLSGGERTSWLVPANFRYRPIADISDMIVPVASEAESVSGLHDKMRSKWCWVAREPKT